MSIKFYLYFVFFIGLFFCLPQLRAEGKAFTVVIDAGHGGKDPGARGTKINEKVINLAIALKLGDLIESNQSDVKVVYTRKTDRFIELDERANIANRAKADLFISIHTNSVKKGSSVTGTETYTLGLARTDENLEVAMRENSAILLEDNYLQKYEGFDPNSSESYIIFEFMQNKHMEQSIGLASEIQKAFVSNGRGNRGVRQAGLLVLRKTGMPSVLVEVGFISNRIEENFMRSSDGQDKLAAALYTAFSKFKREYNRKKGALNTSSSITADDAQPNNNYSQPKRKQSSTTSADFPTPAKEVTKNNKGKVIYKIQILTSDKKLSSNSKLFKGYKDTDFYKEKGIYKYTYGESTNFDSVKKLRRSILKDFKDAFIVAFKDGEKVKY